MYTIKRGRGKGRILEDIVLPACSLINPGWKKPLPARCRLCTSSHWTHASGPHHRFDRLPVFKSWSMSDAGYSNQKRSHVLINKGKNDSIARPISDPDAQMFQCPLSQLKARRKCLPVSIVMKHTRMSCSPSDLVSCSKTRTFYHGLLFPISTSGIKSSSSPCFGTETGFSLTSAPSLLPPRELPVRPELFEG
jgi:hypothetical protein